MRFGLIGAGKIGQLRARTIREHPDTTLVAVLDVNEASAAAAAGSTGARVCSSLSAFLDVPMDAVIVSSPIQLHEEACVAAFQRGLHVLCEKPLSNSAASARRIVDAAQAAGRVLGVGFNLRYYPAIKFVKETIGSGGIGTVDHLRVFGGHDGLHNFSMDWQYRAPVSGGGAMWDVGIHMTDVARYLMQEITEVYGMMSDSVLQVKGSEDNAVAVLRNPEGIPASYQATWTEWRGYGFYVEVYGDKGMVRGSYAPMQNLLITQDRPGAPRQRKRKLYPEIMVREKLHTWQSTALLSFKEELVDFLDLAAGRDTGRIADGYAGLRSIEVAEAVRTSASTREAVHLPFLGRMSR
jgi:predicted dehydrogenase